MVEELDRLLGLTWDELGLWLSCGFLLRNGSTEKAYA
jgi:hypothetical protein